MKIWNENADATKPPIKIFGVRPLPTKKETPQYRRAWYQWVKEVFMHHHKCMFTTDSVRAAATLLMNDGLDDALFLLTEMAALSKKP